MCGIFGMLDYKHMVSDTVKTDMIRKLALFSQLRGMDASGYAFTDGEEIKICKKPGPAYKYKVSFHKNSNTILGHCRFTTQGSGNENQNNHPFLGDSRGQFALAHNGILFNTKEIKEKYNLEDTDIATDSYVIVQLLERFNGINYKKIAVALSELKGTFALSIMKESGELFLIKGNNPVMLVHFPEKGIYAYASTGFILKLALHQYLKKWKYEMIKCDHGEMVEVDTYGHCFKSKFELERVGKLQELNYLIWNSFTKNR